MTRWAPLAILLASCAADRVGEFRVLSVADSAELVSVRDKCAVDLALAPEGTDPHVLDALRACQVRLHGVLQRIGVASVFARMP